MIIQNVDVVANYFIQKGMDYNVRITPQKLLTMLYFSYGWYLSSYNERLFDESILAWRYGPIVGSVLYKIKKYGNKRITDVIHIKKNKNRIFIIDEEKNVLNFLHEMWLSYSGFSSLLLRKVSTMPFSPWYNINKQYRHNIPDYTYICDNDIKEYFTNYKKKLEEKYEI